MSTEHCKKHQYVFNPQAPIEFAGLISPAIINGCWVCFRNDFSYFWNDKTKVLNFKTRVMPKEKIEKMRDMFTSKKKILTFKQHKTYIHFTLKPNLAPPLVRVAGSP